MRHPQLYSQQELQIIRDTLPEPDSGIENKHDPNSLIRWLLDLFLIDKSINSKVLQAQRIFQEFIRIHESEIMRVLEDVVQTEVYFEGIAKELPKWEIEYMIHQLDEALTELQAINDNSDYIENYSIKLDPTWQTEYPIRWSLREVNYYVWDLCDWVLTNTYITEYLEELSDEISGLSNIDGVLSYDVSFYLSVQGNIHVVIHQDNNEILDKMITDDKEDTRILLKHIWYSNWPFTIKDTLHIDEYS